MTAAAMSVFSFGCYLVINGLTLIFAPNMLLSWFGIAPTSDPWIRVLGVVVFVLGLYYASAGRQGIVAFFRWTIWGRTIVPVAFIALVAAGMAPRQLIVFGLIDAAGAVWTVFAMRARVQSPLPAARGEG